MNIERLTRFAIALEDLAKDHGFEAVETPMFIHGPDGIRVTPSGAILWPVYSADGNLLNSYAVEFKDTQ